MLPLFLRRSAAYLIDSLLLLLFVRPAEFTQRVVGELGGFEWFALQLVAIGIIAFYIVGCHARWGCTLGKLMFGLRVATLDGRIPPPFQNALLRALPVLVIGNVDLVVGTFGPETWRADIFARGRWHANVWQIIALLWICADITTALLTGGRRSLHDMIGNTILTRKI